MDAASELGLDAKLQEIKKDKKEVCDTFNTWLSGMIGFECNCTESAPCSENVTNLPYCMIAEAGRKYCAESCTSCPIQGQFSYIMQILSLFFNLVIQIKLLIFIDLISIDLENHRMSCE